MSKKPRPNSKSLIDLPQEILLKIFSYSDPLDLVHSFSLACKYFKQIAESPILWCMIYDNENELKNDVIASRNFNLLQKAEYMKKRSEKTYSKIVKELKLFKFFNYLIKKTSDHGFYGICGKIDTNDYTVFEDYMVNDIITRFPMTDKRILRIRDINPKSSSIFLDPNVTSKVVEFEFEIEEFSRACDREEIYIPEIIKRFQDLGYEIEIERDHEVFSFMIHWFNY